MGTMSMDSKALASTRRLRAENVTTVLANRAIGMDGRGTDIIEDRIATMIANVIVIGLTVSIGMRAGVIRAAIARGTAKIRKGIRPGRAGDDWRKRIILRLCMALQHGVR